jgi:hypothetical protein
MVATAEKKFRSQLLSHWVQGLQIRRKTAIVGEIQWIRPVDFVEKFVSKFAFSALLGSVGRRLPKRDHNRPHHLPSLARRRLSRLRVTSSPPAMMLLSCTYRPADKACACTPASSSPVSLSPIPFVAQLWYGASTDYSTCLGYVFLAPACQ